MAEGGGGALRQLLVSFGISIEGDKLQEFAGQIDGVKEKLIKLGETLAGGYMGEKIAEFVQGQIEAGAQLKRTAEMLGVGTDELQRFQLAAQESGASAEDASGGLRFLNRSIGDALTGSGDAVAMFQKLGVTLKDAKGDAVPVTDVAVSIADAFAKMKSQGERTSTAMKLFGRGGATMVNMLSQGGPKIRALFGDLDTLGGAMGEDFVEKSHEAEVSQIRLNVAMTSLKSTIASAIIPFVVNVTDKVTKWVVQAAALAKHSKALKLAFDLLKTAAVVGAFKALAVAATMAASAIGPLLAEFMSFALPVALVYGLYLILQDLFVMMHGGQSEIGELLDRFMGVGTAAALTQQLWMAWKQVTDLWEQAGPLLDGIGASIMAGVVESLKTAGDMVAGLVRLLIGAGQEIKGLYKYATGDTVGGEKDMQAGDKSNAAAFRNFGAAFTNDGNLGHFAPPGTPGAAKANQAAAQQVMIGPPSLPYGPPAPGMNVKPGPVTNNNKYDVRVTTGSGDPKVIAKAVADGMGDAYQRDMRNAAAAMGGGG
jgi:hypothetical protein